jgi:lipopolysaccharide export system protein LptA
LTRPLPIHPVLRAILPALLLLSPALWAADKVVAPKLAKKKLPAISLLPDGSQLHGVMLPRYDEKQRLAGVLKCGAMTLVNDHTIAGETVSIEFFQPDRSLRGRVDLVRAIFDQAKGMLRASETVTLRAERISTRAEGLIYAFERGEGFLIGPASTRIQAPPPETSMHNRPSALPAAAALGVALLTPVSTAAPLAEDKPLAATHAAASSEARRNLRADLDASAAATAAAREFLEQSELAAASATPENPPPAQPLDVKPGPDDTTVTCDGGMYFNADEGVFVYLKNVRVQDPRFTLSGAAELKIFLGREADAKPAAEASGMGLGAKFGDVERIVATGAVRIVQKQVESGKQPVEASGAIFSYQPKTGEITLTGGYPWVKQGSTFMRALQPNLSLRIQKSGSFVTEGNWDMGGRLDQNR